MLTEREAGFRRILAGYKSRAKRKGISWELTDFDAKVLLASACYYCQSTPQRAYNRRGATLGTDYPDLFEANGIDRIDSAGSYSLANCRPACWACNRAKSDQTDYAFFLWVRTVYDSLTSRGLL